MQSGAVMISNFLQLFTKSTLNQRETVQMYVTNITGADPGFFLGGGPLVSCSTSTRAHPPAPSP